MFLNKSLVRTHSNKCLSIISVSKRISEIGAQIKFRLTSPNSVIIFSISSHLVFVNHLIFITTKPVLNRKSNYRTLFIRTTVGCTSNSRFRKFQSLGSRYAIQSKSVVGIHPFCLIFISNNLEYNNYCWLTQETIKKKKAFNFRFSGKKSKTINSVQ